MEIQSYNIPIYIPTKLRPSFKIYRQNNDDHNNRLWRK